MSYASPREIRKVFNTIAKSFSRTRRRPWRYPLEIVNNHLEGPLADLGCGNGRHALLMAMMGFECIGLDISPELLKMAKELVKVFNIHDLTDFVEADIRFLPFRDKAFRGIIFIATLHHISPRKLRIHCLKEVRRVLKPNSKAVVTTWTKLKPSAMLKCLLFKLKNPRAEFGDVLIPWKLKSQKVLRFYHLYTQRELEEDCFRAGLSILKSYRDYENHVVVVSRSS